LSKSRAVFRLAFGGITAVFPAACSTSMTRSSASPGSGFAGPRTGSGFIGQQNGGLHGRQKVIGSIEVVCLTAGEDKADRIAKCVDQGVDLGAQSSAGATDGLVFARFFWAPALC